MDLEAAAILRRARELIGTEEKWLWGKGTRSDDGTRRCIGCAIIDAAGCTKDFGDTVAQRFFEAFAKALKAQTGITGTQVMIAFNARPATTHTEVLATFARAIALAEGKDYAAPQARISDTEYTRRFMKEIEQVKEVV